MHSQQMKILSFFFIQHRQLKTKATALGLGLGGMRSEIPNAPAKF